MFSPAVPDGGRRRDNLAGAQFGVGGGDNLAAKYSALAGDGSQGPKVREAAMLFSAAEHSLNVDEDIATAGSKASEALALFREVGDAGAVADVLRLIINVHLDSEEYQAALDLATAELEKFRATSNSRGEAAMLLSTAEASFNNFGAERREQALEQAQEAHRLFKEAQDHKMECIALLSLVQGLMVKATKHDSRRETERAIERSKEALEAARRSQDPTLQAKALHALAVAHAHLDEIDDAIKFGRQALGFWREAGSKKFEGVELRYLAEWHLVDDAAEEALKSAQAAHKLFEEVGNAKGWEAASLTTVVKAMLKMEDTETAMQTAQDAVRSFRRRSDDAGEIEMLRILVEVHLSKEDRVEAIAACEACLDAVRNIPKMTIADKKSEASVFHSMAHIHVVEDQSAKAKEACEAAVKLYNDVGDKHSAMLILHTLSSSLVGLKEHREAIKTAAEARDFFRKRGHKRGHAYSCLACSQAYASRGDHNRAISMTKEALKIFTEERHRRGEAESLGLLAEIYLIRGSVLKSLNFAREARELFRQTKQPIKELEELFITTRAAFWVANEGGVPEKKGEKPSAAWEEALEAGLEALALARKMAFDRSITAALFGIGQVYVITRRPDDAAKVIDEALPMAKAQQDDRAEANLEILTSQMHIMNGKDDEAVPPAKRAVEIFRERLHEREGEEIAAELIRFVEGGGSAPPPPEQDEGGADGEAASQVTAVQEYQGPTMEDLLATISDVALSLIGVDSLAGDTPLMDAGLDSLASVEFQNNLQKEFAGVQLPSTLVFDFPSVKTMADFINGGLREAAGFS